MKKIVLAIYFFMFLPFIGFAQSPLSDTGLSSTYQETDGYCIIGSFGRLRYWLYNTYKYNNGDSSDLLRALVTYTERLGWTIDYDNIKIVSPNDDLATSVKLMMLSKNSDISLTIIEYDKKTAALYINNHDKQNDIWETIIFPLIK